MQITHITLATIILAGSSFVSCSVEPPKPVSRASADQEKNDGSDPKIDKDDPAKPTKPSDIDPTPTPTGGAVVIGGGTPAVLPPLTCNVKDASYNPTGARCTINFTQESYPWRNVPSVVQSFPDGSAVFISSTTPTTARSANYPTCANHGGNNTIAVTHFTVTKESVYKFHLLSGLSFGSMYIWPNGDSSGEGFEMRTQKWDIIQNGQATFKPGHYVVVLVFGSQTEGTGDGAGTGGAALVIKNSSGSSVVKSGAGDWCVFNASTGVMLDEFVRDAAGCKTCFRGKQ